jgi:hypothetical protein
VGRGKRGREVGAAACIAAAILTGAPAALGEEPEWDQERVAELAAELDGAVQSLLADPGLESKQRTALQQRRHHSAIVGVREFSRMASDLARRLRSGRGYEQTRPIWDQMRLVRKEIRYYASESWVPEATQEKASRAVALIDQIEPYYDRD